MAKCRHKNCDIVIHQTLLSVASITDGQVTIPMGDGEPTFVRYEVECFDCGNVMIYRKKAPKWLAVYLAQT